MLSWQRIIELLAYDVVNKNITYIDKDISMATHLPTIMPLPIQQYLHALPHVKFKQRKHSKFISNDECVTVFNCNTFIADHLTSYTIQHPEGGKK